jgi:hypothetical protein
MSVLGTANARHDCLFVLSFPLPCGDPPSKPAKSMACCVRVCPALFACRLQRVAGCQTSSMTHNPRCRTFYCHCLRHCPRERSDALSHPVPYPQVRMPVEHAAPGLHGWPVKTHFIALVSQAAGWAFTPSYNPCLCLMQSPLSRASLNKVRAAASYFELPALGNASSPPPSGTPPLPVACPTCF